MKLINLEIILPTGIALELQLEHLIIPGIDGDFGVSAGHTPFLTTIRPGVLIAYSKTTEYFAIHDGFVVVENDLVRILSETFELQSVIDEQRVKDSLSRAQNRLKATNEEKVNYRRAEFSLKRAVARMDTLTKAD